MDSVDCVSMDASSECLEESAVTEKETDGEPECVNGQQLAGSDFALSSGDPTADDGAVMTARESQSSETSRFTRTISPPTLGTLRNCFSWSGSLGDFSRTSSPSPSPSPSAALQQFRRRTDSPTAPPGGREASHVSQLKSEGSGEEAPPLRPTGCSPQSPESAELSPHDINVSKLSQPSSKDSDSEVSHIIKPLFSNLHVRENRVLIRTLGKCCLCFGNNWLSEFFILDLNV